MLFGTLASIALILFANTDESGGDFRPSLQFLSVGFALTIISLAALVLYEHVVKPLVFPPSVLSTTSDSEVDNSHSLNNIDSFNIKDTGALQIGAV